MNIIDYLRLKTMELGGEKFTPESKFTFLSPLQNERKARALEMKAWYEGDGRRLENFYLNKVMDAWEGLTLDNSREYFWGIAQKEFPFKKIHSGKAHDIISTLVGIVGEHNITTDDIELQKRIDEIAKFNDLEWIINQEELPLALAQGWGAFKINTHPDYDLPLVDYYHAENVEFIGRNRRVEAVIFQDNYDYNNKKYVLFEVRSIRRGEKAGSYIEYELFEKNEDKVSQVPLNTIPHLSDLQNIYIPGYKKLLAVPVVLFNNANDFYYGRSILTGKIDLLDELDKTLSIGGLTLQFSPPVEYMPVELMDKNEKGEPIMPKSYMKQFIKVQSNLPGGDGQTSNAKVDTSQPDLNFQQYLDYERGLLDSILTGVLSPATLGVDVAKRDNAEAQREKEKVSILTRNNIIKSQTDIVREVMEIALDLEEFIRTGHISPQEHDFAVSYNEFASPTFEQKAETLQNLFTSGGISVEKYVDMLWGEMMSEDEKLEEVERIKAIQEADNLDLGEFDATEIGIDPNEKENRDNEPNENQE